MLLKKIVLTVFTLLIGVMLIASPALAYVDGLGYIYLTTDGGTDLVGSDWKFYVQTPPAVGLDAAYWNFTCYADPLNASATNATFYVHYHIYDGVTNITANETIAAKNDVRVYANISFEQVANYTDLVENKSANLYVELLDADYATVDDYNGVIMIYEYSYISTIVVLLYAIIPIVILMTILNMLKLGGKGGMKG